MYNVSEQNVEHLHKQQHNNLCTQNSAVQEKISPYSLLWINVLPGHVALCLPVQWEGLFVHNVLHDHIALFLLVPVQWEGAVCTQFTSWPRRCSYLSSERGCLYTIYFLATSLFLPVKWEGLFLHNFEFTSWPRRCSYLSNEKSCLYTMYFMAKSLFLPVQWEGLFVHNVLHGHVAVLTCPVRGAVCTQCTSWPRRCSWRCCRVRARSPTGWTSASKHTDFTRNFAFFEIFLKKEFSGNTGETIHSFGNISVYLQAL